MLFFLGGVCEVFKWKNEKYKFFWFFKLEFICMVIKYDVIIVSFAAIGVEDFIDIVVDVNDLMNNFIVGDFVCKCL